MHPMANVRTGTKKRKRAFPDWLHFEEDLCYSDRQVASGADMTGMQKKYRRMMCLYCAEHNKSPWSIMKARKFESATFDEHEGSTHHIQAAIKSCGHYGGFVPPHVAKRIRSDAYAKNPSMLSSSSSAVAGLFGGGSEPLREGEYVIDDDDELYKEMQASQLRQYKALEALIYGAPPSDNGSSSSSSSAATGSDGVPGAVTLGGDGQGEQNVRYAAGSITADGELRNDNDDGNDNNVDRTNPAAAAAGPEKKSTGPRRGKRNAVVLPEWLVADSKLTHSIKQMESGEDLSKVKKKCRAAMCSVCAQYNSSSSWSEMRIRKFETQIVFDHERSSAHRQALAARNIALHAKQKGLTPTVPLGAATVAATTTVGCGAAGGAPAAGAASYHATYADMHVGDSRMRQPTMQRSCKSSSSASSSAITAAAAAAAKAAAAAIDDIHIEDEHDDVVVDEDEDDGDDGVASSSISYPLPLSLEHRGITSGSSGGGGGMSVPVPLSLHNSIPYQGSIPSEQLRTLSHQQQQHSQQQHSQHQALQLTQHQQQQMLAHAHHHQQQQQQQPQHALLQHANAMYDEDRPHNMLLLHHHHHQQQQQQQQLLQQHHQQQEQQQPHHLSQHHQQTQHQLLDAQQHQQQQEQHQEQQLQNEHDPQQQQQQQHYNHLQIPPNLF